MRSVKKSTLLCVVAMSLSSSALAQQFQSAWDRANDRTWVGASYWANRLQDWRVADGRLECVDDRKRAMRTVHLLTHRLSADEGSFDMSVRTGVIDGVDSPDSMVGFLIGVGGEKMDYRAAAIVHSFGGNGAGIFAGIDGEGKLFIRDNEAPVKHVDADRVEGALNRNKWRVAEVDGAEKGFPGSNAIDGIDSTYWHTPWQEAKPPHPHAITIDLGGDVEFDGFAYLPRQGSDSGRVGDFEFEAARNGTRESALLALGKFRNTPAMQHVSFDRTSAEQVIFRALSSVKPQPATSVAELYLTDSTRQPVARSIEGELGSNLSVFEALDLRIHAETEDDGCVIVLSVHEPGRDAPIREIRKRFESDRLIGNVALVSHPGENNAHFWFEEWAVSGDKVFADAFAQVGPILSAQHTLSRGVLKLTAQLMPVAEVGEGVVALQVGGYGKWRTIATSPVIRPGFTAGFRVPEWDDTIESPYRVMYEHVGRDSIAMESVFEGVIRRDPVDKETVVLAGLSCNHNNSHNLGGGWGATTDEGRGNWADLMWFPHQDMIDQVVKHEPDVLFFAGDQLYEGASPTGADRKNIMLDYLYKWYLWCWAYRDLTRDLPTVTIPDDHDVFQGNVWGHGGRPTRRDNQGGYVHSAEFVKMVDRTQTSHLPDAYDPTPIDQDIGVYYTDMVYGRVSFGIFEDRKFKSGCADPLLPPSGTGRPDHFNDPDFDTADLNMPHLKLLGERQLEFLEHWAADWKGNDMKVALSQTVLANMATHHGRQLGYLIADLDSNGWPQDGRDRAVSTIRKGFALHIAGDQHVATAIQHGVSEHNDSMWSFCVPAIANFYPRKWMPPRAGANRGDGDPEWKGEHVDGFGNLVTVHAVANPTPEGLGREPKDLHDGMAGYGIIRFDKANRQTTIECWPRFADPEDPSTGGQYEGWPIVIDQVDNFNPASWSKLPEIRVENVDNAVFQVIDDESGETVYTIRINGRAWTPHVPSTGTYSVRVGVPETDTWVTLRKLKPTDLDGDWISVTVQ